MWRCEYLSRLYNLQLDLLKWAYFPNVAVSHKYFFSRNLACFKRSLGSFLNISQYNVFFFIISLLVLFLITLFE